MTFVTIKIHWSAKSLLAKIAFSIHITSQCKSKSNSYNIILYTPFMWMNQIPTPNKHFPLKHTFNDFIFLFFWVFSCWTLIFVLRFLSLSIIIGEKHPHAKKGNSRNSNCWTMYYNTSKPFIDSTYSSFLFHLSFIWFILRFLHSKLSQQMRVQYNLKNLWLSLLSQKLQNTSVYRDT